MYCTSTSHTMPLARAMSLPPPVSTGAGGGMTGEGEGVRRPALPVGGLVTFSWIGARPPMPMLPERPMRVIVELLEATFEGLRRLKINTTGSPGTVTLNSPSGSSVKWFCRCVALQELQSYWASR